MRRRTDERVVQEYRDGPIHQVETVRVRRGLAWMAQQGSETTAKREGEGNGDLPRERAHEPQ